jgi:hypothetical protein
MMTTRCWANVLDDCEGGLTREHLVSSAAVRPDERDRDKREQSPMVVENSRGTLRVPLRGVVAKVLCKRHNELTSPLDEAGASLTRAFQDFVAESVRRPPGLHRKLWEVNLDGRAVERWLLKTVINNAIAARLDLPIGGVDAPTGLPTKELVEMVFGRRPIEPPCGLWGTIGARQAINAGPAFRFQFADADGAYIVGCLVHILRFRLIMNFVPMGIEMGVVRGRACDQREWLESTPVQPLLYIADEVRNMRINFDWQSKSQPGHRSGNLR